MPTYSATDVSVVFNSVDLSDHVKKVTVDYAADGLDDTTMGTSGTRSQRGGLKNWSVDVEFLQDHTGSSVDATLFPLVGSTATLTIKPTSSAVSSTNPRFFGTALLLGYKVFDVEVGDLSKTVAHFENAGALTRATT